VFPSPSLSPPTLCPVEFRVFAWFTVSYWCNKRSAYIERPTPPSSKTRPHFKIRPCLGENKDHDYGSRGDWSQEWLCWRRAAAI
jgi:hypothetical protein